MPRELKFFQAINEATDLCLAHDPNVYVMGLGVPDPKGVFGTTLGLEKKHGSHRVMDMPTSENGMTGVAIGSALVGMRPVMVHQRIDFALLAMDQIVNQAAKWYYTFGGKMQVPLVIRMVIGRGWGQGPQHSQNLQSWFTHIPGIKVVMPATPHDAKGLLIASVQDNNPVIYIEHRWLHNTFGNVPEGHYTIPLGKARIVKEGSDVTIATFSYGVREALQATEFLSRAGIQAEVVDLRTLRPLDSRLLIESVCKTGRLIVMDTGWKFGGFGGEIVSLAAEEAFSSLKCAPRRLGMPDCPVSTSPALAKFCYPGTRELVVNICEMLQISAKKLFSSHEEETALARSDVPYSRFTGPF